MKHIKYPVRQARRTSRLPVYGSKVKIKNKITPMNECGGFLVKGNHILCRRPNEQGEYNGWVPGAGGDIWWIKHSDGTIGAYTFDELTDIK
jgi:hypothetical protein